MDLTIPTDFFHRGLALFPMMLLLVLLVFFM